MHQETRRSGAQHQPKLSTGAHGRLYKTAPPPCAFLHQTKLTIPKGLAAAMARWSHLASLAVALALVQAAASEHWLTDYFFTDGDVRASYDASGQQVATVSLTQQSGSGGFNSKKKFLFGEFSMRIKLIPGNSAGTVSFFYVRLF
jgi:hypothetical protein